MKFALSKSQQLLKVHIFEEKYFFSKVIVIRLSYEQQQQQQRQKFRSTKYVGWLVLRRINPFQVI